jgi:Flp pilus assembly protein CpaB
MEWVENALSTRRGTLMIGGAAAVLAAIILVVYLKNYRSSVDASNATDAVLVAKNMIQKGAPGNFVAADRQYQVTSIRAKELQTGAISDPGTLRGLVAAHDIYPGQQLTTSDFVAAAPGALQTNLSGDQRAIAIPVDAAHGMSGQLAPGDHVDVYAGLNQSGMIGGARPVIKLLMENALVLRTATTGAPVGAVVLRGRGPQTAALAFAADNGKIWLVLRPASGARPEKVSLMDTSVLLGLRPVR